MKHMKFGVSWELGLIVILIGSLINGLLIRADVGGLIRELMRLVIIFGIIIFVLGIGRRFRKGK